MAGVKATRCLARDRRQLVDHVRQAGDHGLLGDVEHRQVLGLDDGAIIDPQLGRRPSG